MLDFQSIIASVMSAMSLVRIPKNIGTGRYSTWTDEAKTHNETVVRPFRQNVAKAVKVQFDVLTDKLSIENKDALVTLLNDISADDCLKFPELCYGTPARDTKQSNNAPVSSVMTYEVFKSAVKVASPKVTDAQLNKAYADYLLSA